MAPETQMGTTARVYQPDQLLVQNRHIGNVLNHPLANSNNILESKILSNASIVLIVAYMRTGSTLLGEILREIPDSFYIFEPLRTIESKFNQNTGDTKDNDIEMNTANNITRSVAYVSRHSGILTTCTAH